MPGPAKPLWGPRTALERARPYLLTLLLPVIVLAAGSLVLEYGFPMTPQARVVLHWVEVVALAGLLLDPMLRLLLAKDRLALLRFRWFDFALAAALLAVVGGLYGLGVPGADRWAIRAIQVTILLCIAGRVLELHRYLAAQQIRPAPVILGSFLTLIAVGTGLLLLPASTAPGRGETTFMEALFTATSAVCVTGLVVVDTGTHWSRFGQSVVLTLIQLGGLGLMTYASVLALLLWRGMRVRETLVLREVFSHDLRAEIGRVTIFILLTTLAIEAAGAVLLMGLWDAGPGGGDLSRGDRIYASVFHSISAFCNAGFALQGDSLIRHRSAWQVNLVFPLLIISGGIGFTVLYNLARVARYRLPGRRRAVPVVKRRLSLHAKLALVTTAVLLVAGTLVAYVFETFPRRAGAWAERETAGAAAAPGPASQAAPQPWVLATASAAPAAVASDPASRAASRPGAEPASQRVSPMGETWSERLRGAWFLATTARTAGFNTVSMERLTAPTKFLTILLMFIGASPGSTGGGIKTVTFAVILCGVWAALRGAAAAQVFRRSIPGDTVRRALAILAVAAAWIALVSMVLSAWGLREGARSTFLDVAFETTSAFATVGLSTGATPDLDTLGRVLILVTMFVGRVGPLTLFVAMQGWQSRPRYEYATEGVAIS